MSEVSSRRSILIAANTAWYVYNFRKRFIEDLIRTGYAVVVVSPRDEYSSRLGALGVNHIHLEIDNRVTNPFNDFIAIFKLLLILWKERPTVMLTFTPKLNIYGAIAGQIASMPVVSNISGLGSGFIRGGWLSWFMKLLYRYALRSPRTVFFQNSDDRNLFIKHGLVSSERAKTLPGSGVDLHRFRPIERNRTCAYFVFLFVGRLLEDKGIREFVEAAKITSGEFPTARFKVLGLRDSRNPTVISSDRLEEWKRSGLVEYLGATDDVIAYYADADCVVLPSYREGCPRCLLEACSMEIPVIATDVPGCRDVVRDGINGFICRPRDSHDLARQMQRMLKLSPFERKKMGIAGRSYMVQSFDEATVIRRYFEAIEFITADNENCRHRSGWFHRF